MNAQVQTPNVIETHSLAELADPTTVEAKLAELEQLSNDKLEQYYVRRDELNKQIAEMTRAGNQKAIEAAKSELSNVEHEIAKRAENIGLIMSAIGKEMGMLETLGERLMEDSPEDIAKREAAHATLKRVRQALIDAKAAVQAAEAGKTSAEADLANAEGTMGPILGWDAFGKGAKVTTAKAALAKINKTITDGPAIIAGLEEDLAAAEVGVVSVEEEIEVDKDHRLKELNLDQLYAKLADAEARVSDIVKENIGSLETNIANTETQLVLNRELGVSSAEELQQLKSDISTESVRLDEMKAQLEDMVGQEDTPEYKTLENDAHALATKLDGLQAKQRLTQGKMSMAQVNVTELEASMRALNSDIMLARENYNDFQLTAEKARVAGDNIALLLKTQAAKVSADSLSKGRDAMTLASLDASIATDTANRATMANNAKRRLSLLDQMSQRVADGEAAGAEHDRDYEESTDAYREKYGKLGTGRGGSGASNGDESSGGEEKKERGAPDLY